MNPYIYIGLPGKEKMDFLKAINGGLPSCKQILDFMCKHYHLSKDELLKDKKLRKFFVYLCYRIHDPEYFERKKRAKNGLCTEIKILINRKQHGTVKNICETLIIYLKIYKHLHEEIVSLYNSLFLWWRGGK